MEEFTQLFGNLLAFVYHCFDRIVIHGYLSGLSRPEQVVYFVRQVLGLPGVNKEVLSQRTGDYRDWVEAYARNHHLPMEWAEKGVRKEDYVSPRLHRLIKNNAYGVYFIFKSMEQGQTFRISVPKYPTADPNYRILAHQRSRFTHYYFYIRDEVLGPIVLRVGSFLSSAEKIARLEREIETLKKENERLRGLLEEALRSAKRQAAPFSRRHPKACPQKPGRKPGRKYGCCVVVPSPEPSMR